MTKAEFARHPITLRCRELSKLPVARLRDKVRGTSRVGLGSLRDLGKQDCVSFVLEAEFGRKALVTYNAERPQ